MSRPQRVLVLEIDGHRWVGTLADLDKQAIRVVDGRHGSQDGDKGELDVDEIVSWITERGHGHVPLHLVCAHRDLVCTEVELPRQSSEELAANLRAVARRACDLSETAPVWLAHRAVRKEKNTIRHAVVSLKQSGPISRLVQHDELSTRSIVTMQEALLNALPDDVPDRSVLVAVGPGSARVLCLAAGEVQYERRAHFDGRLGLRRCDVESIEDLLSFELPLTLDYLAELGAELPVALVCSPFLGLEEEALERVAGDLKWMQTEHKVAPPESGLARRYRPGLATIGLLRHLGTGAGVLTTLVFGKHDEARIGKASRAPVAAATERAEAASEAAVDDKPPTKRSKKTATSTGAAPPEPAARRARGASHRSRPLIPRVAAYGAIAIALVLAGIVAQPLWTGSAPPKQDEPAGTSIQSATTNVDTDSPGVTDTGSPRMNGGTSGSDASATDVGTLLPPDAHDLVTYPASLLLVEAANRAPDDVVLEELGFDDASGITLSGRIAGADQKAARRVFSEYRDALSRLPFLEDVKGKLSAAGSYRTAFELTARWSAPAP